MFIYRGGPFRVSLGAPHCETNIKNQALVMMTVFSLLAVCTLHSVVLANFCVVNDCLRGE
jgi:hypothetical protein